MKLKKGLIFKIFSSVALSLCLLLCSSSTTFAKPGDIKLESIIFNNIVEDFMMQTGVSKELAREIFNNIQNDEFGVIEQEAINSVPELAEIIDNEDSVIVVQENYDRITHSLSEDEKLAIDKYFMASALKYYKENATIQEFFEPVEKTRGIKNDLSIPVATNPAMGIYDTETIDENVLNAQNETMAASNNVAEVRIFAVSSGEASSSNTSGHAWLTVKNISNGNITVGKFLVAPNKTMVLGTWGNKSEHKGLWYNLEAKFISSYDSYSDRVSLLVRIDSNSLSTLSNYIVNSDSWSLTNNCSSFAVKGWNKICSTQLSAGVVNTPTNLKNSILNTKLYSTKISVPYNYVVYYANGTNTPIRSGVY